MTTGMPTIWPVGPFAVLPTCRASVEDGALVVDPVICFIAGQGAPGERRWNLSLEEAAQLEEVIHAARFQAPAVAARMSHELRGSTIPPT